MNDRQLEQELRGYQPAPASRRLEGGIAERLGAAARAARTRRIVLKIVAGGLAAAACVTLAVWLGGSPEGPPPRRIDSPRSERLTAEQVRALPPTEWGFQQAGRSSREDRALFLEHQANVLLPRLRRDGF